jgi:hypothetical protein
MSALNSLHDGRLTSVAVSESDRTVQLQCSLVDGREVLLILNAVIDLSVNNMRLGNIILFAEVFGSADRVGAEALAGLAQSRDSGVQARYVEMLARRGATGPRWFVLQSSYGADIACVFDGDLVEDVRTCAGETPTPNDDR